MKGVFVNSITKSNMCKFACLFVKQLGTHNHQNYDPFMTLLPSFNTFPPDRFSQNIAIETQM